MLQRALDATAPGMADIVDLDSLHFCDECAHRLPIKGKEGQLRCAQGRPAKAAARLTAGLSQVAIQSRGRARSQAEPLLFERGRGAGQGMRDRWPLLAR
jgi:hypothetical protein